MNYPPHRPIKRITLPGIIVLLLFSFASFAVAEEFHIPAGPLEQVLDGYSDVTGKKPVYMNSLVEGKKSPGVTGNFSSEEAMSKILDGTGLRFTLTHEGNMVIQKADTPDSSSFRKNTSFRKTNSIATTSVDQVVITATKTAIKTKDVPAAVDVVTDEDIELTPGADTYYEALRNVPGVIISQEGQSDSMTIRGMDPSILDNGRDMNAFATGTVLMNNPLNMGMGSVERIEVIKGPQAAIYGSKAISGVVNVIRKKGDKDNPFAELRGFWGSSDEANGGVTLSGGFDNMAYFLDFSAGKQDKYKTSRGNIPYVDYERKNLFARLDYTFSEDHELTFDYTYNRSENTNGGEGYYYEKSEWNNIYRNKPETQGVFLTYNGKFTELFSLYATLGTGKNDYEMVYGGPNYEPIYFLNKQSDTSYKEDIVQGELRGTVTLLDNSFKSILGVQYKNIDVKGHSNKTNDGVTTTAFIWDDLYEKYFAPFVQMEYKPTPLSASGCRCAL